MKLAGHFQMLLNQQQQQAGIYPEVGLTDNLYSPKLTPVVAPILLAFIHGVLLSLRIIESQNN